MFEAETFLVIAKSGSPLDCDPSDLDAVEAKAGAKDLDRQRFEKISEIMKDFRKVCQYVSPFLSHDLFIFLCFCVFRPANQLMARTDVITNDTKDSKPNSTLVPSSSNHFREIQLSSWSLTIRG